MEGIPEPNVVKSMLEIASRNDDAEFEIKMLAGKLLTRDVSERVLTAIQTFATPVSEEHRLTFGHPEGIRAHVTTPERIHKVCMSGLSGVQVSVERKTPYFQGASGRDAIECPDLLSKFTLRRETPLKQDFIPLPNAYMRLVHRKSFKTAHFRIDMSLVKSGTGKGVHAILKNIPSYELEIEYMRGTDEFVVSDVLAEMYIVMKKVLASFQMSPALLLQSEIESYKNEFRSANISFYNIVPLERQHLQGAFGIQKGYTVTNKADGDRGGLFVASDLKLLLILNRGETIVWTGLTAPSSLKGDFMDGEYLPHLQLFCIFDAFQFEKKDVRALPLMGEDDSRLECARKFTELSRNFKISETGFRIETKTFMAGDGEVMEQAIRRMLDMQFEYQTDGLVFTPKLTGVSPLKDTQGSTWMRVYKWKPPRENTIDFLMRFNPGPGSQETQSCTLYVSRSPKDFVIYPCETVTGEYDPPAPHSDLKVSGNRIPSIFQPSAPRDPDAYKLQIPIRKFPVDEEGNKVDDNTIVECFRENNMWKVKRTRYDKTYEYRVLGKPQFGNDARTADSTWKLIHIPVTEEMLRVFVTSPPDATFEDAYYLDETAKTVTTNLRGFHNQIKGKQYAQYILPSNTLIEFAVGRAGDLHKWIKAKVGRVLGLDTSSASFSLQQTGACVRYLDAKRENPHIFPALFTYGDMTVPFETQQGYLSMVFGDVRPSTPYIEAFKNQEWDAVACQFAIHYACATRESFQGFVNNVAAHCKSVLFGTCLDGKAVYSLLAGKTSYTLQSSGQRFVEIVKKYDDSGEWKPVFGQAIDVLLESTEKAQTEYLVPFETVVEMMATAGFELSDETEFADHYTSQSAIALDKAQQQYSFLHKTFKFQRTSKKKVPSLSIPLEEKEEIYVSNSPRYEKHPDMPDTPRYVPSETKTVSITVPEKKRTKKIEKVEEPLPEIVFFFGKEPENKEFSNFYETEFTMDDTKYKSAEHAFQGLKAMTFGDTAAFGKIQKAKSAQSAKAAGKKVADFVPAVWDAKKEAVMRQILRAKFSQNPPLRKQLLDTNYKILAEANPRNAYWGIGTSAGTSIAKNPKKWKGKNVLGSLLMELREEFREEDAADEEE